MDCLLTNVNLFIESEEDKVKMSDELLIGGFNGLEFGRNSKDHSLQPR